MQVNQKIELQNLKIEGILSQGEKDTEKLEEMYKDQLSRNELFNNFVKEEFKNQLVNQEKKITAALERIIAAQIDLAKVSNN